MNKQGRGSRSSCSGHGLTNICLDFIATPACFAHAFKSSKSWKHGLTIIFQLPPSLINMCTLMKLKLWPPPKEIIVLVSLDAVSPPPFFFQQQLNYHIKTHIFRLVMGVKIDQMWTLMHMLLQNSHMEQSSPPYLFEVRVVGVLRIWNSMRVTCMLQLAVLIPTAFLTMFSLWRGMGG